MSRNPVKNLRAGSRVVRTSHRVSGCVPEIGSIDNLGCRQRFHGFPRINAFVAIPRIVEDPGGLAFGKSAKREHAGLVEKPVEERASRGHVVAFAKLILVGDHVYHRVHFVYVRAHTDGFRLDPGIDLGDDHDCGIDSARLFTNLANEVR